MAEQEASPLKGEEAARVAKLRGDDDAIPVMKTAAAAAVKAKPAQEQVKSEGKSEQRLTVGDRMHPQVTLIRDKVPVVHRSELGSVNASPVEVVVEQEGTKMKITISKTYRRRD